MRRDVEAFAFLGFGRTQTHVALTMNMAMNDTTVVQTTVTSTPLIWAMTWVEKTYSAVPPAPPFMA